MKDSPGDDAQLNADALRMRDAIERRLFPGPRLVVPAPRGIGRTRSSRRVRIERGPQRQTAPRRWPLIAIGLALALVLAVAAWLALRG